jgi:hypothetical protein
VEQAGVPLLEVHEPGPHAKHDAEPGAAAHPAGQAVQLAPPAFGLAVPPGQAVQLLAPAVEKVPGGHAGQRGVGVGEEKAPEVMSHAVVTFVKFWDEPAPHE